MSQRVTLCSEVKGFQTRSRSESESDKGAELQGVDPKPGELSMVRVKDIERFLKARTGG